MAVSDNLRSIVASVLRIDPGSITDDSSVSRLNSSIERAKMMRGVKNLGLQLPTGDLGPRFGDLVRSMSGSTVDAALPFAQPSKTVSIPNASPINLDGATPSLKLGVDIEMVASLPEVADTWEDDFYRSNFTDAEIARAQVHSNPRAHLAGVWCAKEALKKSDSMYLDIPFRSIEVAHRSSGAPTLRIFDGQDWRILACSISISHTEEMATAVVGWIGPADQDV